MNQPPEYTESSAIADNILNLTEQIDTSLDNCITTAHNLNQEIQESTDDLKNFQNYLEQKK